MANIQFNATSAKAFRTILEKYYNAQHSICDLMNKRSDLIKSLNGIIASNNDDLAAIADGTYTGKRTADEVKADNQTLLLKIDDARNDYDKAKSAFDKALSAADALYTDDMHKGAISAITSFGASLTEWHSALAAMFVANGLADATSSNVSRFDFLVTAKKNNARRIYKDNALVGVQSKKQSATIFLCALSEYLVSEKLITPFKHKYVPMSERNKKKSDK